MFRGKGIKCEKERKNERERNIDEIRAGFLFWKEKENKRDTDIISYRKRGKTRELRGEREI